MTTATRRMLVTMALAAQVGAVAAQQAPAVDTSQWVCEYCVAPAGPESEIGVSAENVSQDSYRFSRYTGFEKGTGWGLDATLRSRSGLNYADVYVTRLGLPYGTIEAEGGKQGTYKLTFRYAELPFNVSNSALTVFDGTGSNRLTLPLAWLRGVNTGFMPGLAGSLHSAKIDSLRTQSGVGLSFVPSGGWEVGLKVRQETREGTQRMAGSFFFNSTPLIVPIDYDTKDVEAYASYATRAWQVRLAYQGSFFGQHNKAVIWDNPFAEFAPGATTGQIGSPPGNQFHQVSASGAYQFSEVTRANANIALGRMVQDSKFLSATINGVLAPGALPRDSLEGQIQTTRADLKLVTALSPKWGLNLAFVHDNRDNKTPQATFNWVTTDMLVATPRANLPYSFTRNVYKVSTDYRVTPRAKASLGFDRDMQDRTNQEVSKTTEDTLWAKYALRTRRHFDVTLNYAHARREGEAYQAVSTLSPPENPLLRKYNMADRSQDLVGMRMAVLPVETVTLALDYSQAKEDYSKSAVGLTLSERRTLGANLAAQLGEDSSASLYYSIEQIKSQQSGAQSFTNPADWTAENLDRIRTAGVGLKHALIPKRFDLGADYTHSHSIGDVTVSTGAGGPGFPSNTVDLEMVKLYAHYRLASGLSVQANFWRERYGSSNWALDGVSPATLPNVLTSGETSPNYKVRVVNVALRYAF
ncbi:MAG: MtrB/PioB family decaheme-associated outer membrane protein [Betaproteobacteria bacterium]|nr:MtrB/PioB family decaheme-associated outer membrane protein [Betaproteobacteria bacterium]